MTACWNWGRRRGGEVGPGTGDAGDAPSRGVDGVEGRPRGVIWTFFLALKLDSFKLLDEDRISAGAGSVSVSASGMPSSTSSSSRPALYLDERLLVTMIFCGEHIVRAPQVAFSRGLEEEAKGPAAYSYCTRPRKRPKPWNLRKRLV